MGITNQGEKAFRRLDRAYYPTTNLHLAAVLVARDFTLASVDCTDPDHCQFAFRESFALQQLISRFNARETVLVDAHKFIFAWKTLRGKMRGKRY